MKMSGRLLRSGPGFGSGGLVLLFEKCHLISLDQRIGCCLVVLRMTDGESFGPRLKNSIPIWQLVSPFLAVAGELHEAPCL